MRKELEDSRDLNSSRIEAESSKQAVSEGLETEKAPTAQALLPRTPDWPDSIFSRDQVMEDLGSTNFAINLLPLRLYP